MIRDDKLHRFNQHHHVYYEKNHSQSSRRWEFWRQKYVRVWKYFKVRRGPWYFPHAHCNVVGQLSGLQQRSSELLRVG